MPKPIELPPAVARAFDMKAFFACGHRFSEASTDEAQGASWSLDSLNSGRNHRMVGVLGANYNLGRAACSFLERQLKPTGYLRT